MSGSSYKQPRIPVQTQEEYQMFDNLRKAYTMRSIGALARYLLMRECENKTLVKNNLDKVKADINQSE